MSQVPGQVYQKQGLKPPDFSEAFSFIFDITFSVPVGLVHAGLDVRWASQGQREVKEMLPSFQRLHLSLCLITFTISCPEGATATDDERTMRIKSQN